MIKSKPPLAGLKSAANIGSSRWYMACRRINLNLNKELEDKRQCQCASVPLSDRTQAIRYQYEHVHSDCAQALPASAKVACCPETWPSAQIPRLAREAVLSVLLEQRFSGMGSAGFEAWRGAKRRWSVTLAHHFWCAAMIKACGSQWKFVARRPLLDPSVNHDFPIS